MASPINPFDGMWRQQNRVDASGNWKGIWGQQAAINGYNSWWNNLKDGWTFKDWFDPDKPFNTHHQFMGSISFGYGLVEGQDRDNDGFLSKTEFEGLSQSAFTKSKLDALFRYIDADVYDASNNKIASKDNKISHGELAAFLYLADNIGNKDQTVTADEMNTLLTKLENNDSITTFENHAKSYKEQKDSDNNGKIDLITESNKNLRSALQEYQNFYLDTAGKNIGGHVVNMIAGGNPTDGGGVNLDLDQSNGVQIDWSKIARNTSFDSLYGEYEEEDYEQFKENGDIDAADFFNLEEIDDEDPWLIGFKPGNTAAFAIGLIEAFEGENGVLSKEKITELYKDDSITLKQKKILENIGGSDKSVTAFEMYVFVKIMDKNQDGQITPEERKKFFNDLDTKLSKSTTYTGTAASISTLGDLRDYIGKFTDNSENNNPDDIKIDKKAYEEALNFLKDEDVDVDYSDAPESDLLHFSDEGGKVKKPLGQDLRYTDATTHSDYNTAAFLDGLYNKFDTDQDNMLTLSELKAGKNSKYSKLIELFEGNKDAGLSRENFAMILKMADYIGNDKIDGVATKSDIDKLVTYFGRLDADENMSAEFDVYANNAFKTMKTVGDFQEFYKLILDGGDESSNNTDPFEVNAEAMAQAEEDRHNSGEYIYKSYDILNQLDGNNDGVVSKDEYREVVDANANGKEGAAYRKYVQDEMTKFTQIAGLAGDINKLTTAEYAAFLAMADTDSDLDASTDEIKDLRDKAFDRTNDDYNSELKKKLQTVSKQMTNSQTYKDIQEEMDKYYKEREKEEKEAKDKKEEEDDTPPQQKYPPGYPYMDPYGGMYGGYGTNPYMMGGGGYGGYGGYGNYGGYGMSGDPLLNMGMSPTSMNTWMSFGGGSF